MRVLVQFGHKPDSLVEHLIGPVAQAKNVDKVHLVCRRRGPDLPKVEYHCTPAFLRKRAPLAVAYEFFNLMRLAVFGRPDCISGFLIFPHITMAFIAAKLTGKPVVASLISGPYEFFTKGTLAGFDMNGPPPWYGKLFLKILKHSDAITTTGTITRDFIVKHGIEAEKIHPMIAPADRTMFFPAGTPKEYDVISVGSLIGIKHNEQVLYAVSKVKATRPGIKACIVGRGPRMEELKTMAKDLGIEANVDFLGFQPDLGRCYNAARIFVHTSEREGFPTVYKEAIACGLPAVVSNCGDITDLAQDGFNSIVIQRYNDSEAFASAILRLLEDQALYKKLSQNALMTHKQLRIETVTDAWQKILESITTSRDTSIELERQV